MGTKKIIVGKGQLCKGIDPTTLLGCGGRLSPGTPHPRLVLSAKFPASFPVRKPVARDLSPPSVLLLGSPVEEKLETVERERLLTPKRAVREGGVPPQCPQPETGVQK